VKEPLFLWLIKPSIWLSVNLGAIDQKKQILIPDWTNFPNEQNILSLLLTSFSGVSCGRLRP